MTMSCHRVHRPRSRWRCCWRRCCSAIINRTKAFFAGRHGPPLLQLYYDLCEAAAQGRGLQPHDDLGLPRRPGRRRWPPCWRAAAARAARRRCRRRSAFAGDLVLFAYLLGLMRFFTVLAALDTGSSLRGHGREPRGALLRPGRAGAAARPGRRGPARGSLSLSRHVAAI